MRLVPELVRELENFKVKTNTRTAHDYYEVWQGTDLDDLVVAAARACWAGARFLRQRLRVTAKPVGL